DRDAPHLVRVEPRKVHVRDASRRKAQIAEDDVLYAFVEEVAAVRDRLRRLLLEQVEDDGEVVHAERPQRVLVLADLAEVLAVAIHAEHVSELALLDQLLELADARVV